MTFVPGATIGPYQIIEQLGQGGMATVYKAFHANLDRYVAMKVLHPAFKQDEKFQGRFEREAKVVAKLDHPNIVPVYDFNEHEGSSYLVMRFVEGETLKAQMLRGSLPPERVVELISKIGDALTYAHAQGVLHRDIKPSNIIVNKEGRVFVADFGLARIAEQGESTLSQDSMMGTPAYMSPEQARGEKELDAGTDIYSLGVVLYELAVGRAPFTADTPFAVIHDHIYSPLPPPRSMNPNVPESVERVLLKTLAKDREDRYATANEMAQAFSEAVASAGPEAVANMTATLATSTIPVTPPVPRSATGTAPSSPTEDMDAATAALPKRRRRWPLYVAGLLGTALLCAAVLFFIIPSIQENAQEAAEAEFEEFAGEQEPGFEEISEEELGELAPPSGTGHCPIYPGEFNVLPVEVAEGRMAEYPGNACAHLELAVAYGELGEEELAQENLFGALDLGLSGPTLISLGDLMVEDSFESGDPGARLLATELYFNAYVHDEIAEAEFMAYWTILDGAGPDAPISLAQTPQGQELLEKMSGEFPDYAFPQSVRATITLYEDNVRQAEQLAVEAIGQQPDSLIAHYAMGEVFFDEFLRGERNLAPSIAQYFCVISNAPPGFRSDLSEGLRSDIRFYIEEMSEELTEEQLNQLRAAAEAVQSGERPDFLQDGAQLPESMQGCGPAR